MSNFDIEVETRQIYKCADGVEFGDLNLAKAHNADLKRRAEEAAFLESLELRLQSYLNHVGLDGRNRAQKQTIISQFLLWERTWDGKFIPEKVKEAEPEPEPEVVPEEVQPELNPIVADELECQSHEIDADDIFGEVTPEVLAPTDIDF